MPKNSTDYAKYIDRDAALCISRMSSTLGYLEKLGNRPEADTHPYPNYDAGQSTPRPWLCCKPCMAYKLLKHYKALCRRARVMQRLPQYKDAVRSLHDNFASVRDFLEEYAKRLTDGVRLNARGKRAAIPAAGHSTRGNDRGRQIVL